MARLASQLFWMLLRQFGGLRKGFQCGFVRFVGVFHRSAGMFVAGEVILLIVMRRCGAVRVRCHFVEFGGSLMRIVIHDGSLFG
jgi:hypothetical protein